MAVAEINSTFIMPLLKNLTSLTLTQNPIFNITNIGEFDNDELNYLNGSLGRTDNLSDLQNVTRRTISSWWESGRIQILLYSVILLLSVIGNMLVILTLIQNQRMRTITNVFLLNLAISDLLLGVLCMPFTLIGTLLRNFIFGEVMCKLLPYLQASSVSVSAWTLVAISVERYYAICHPLRSRRWQTLNHSYRLIFLIWTLSLICMLPIAALSQLIPTRQAGHHKCRERWPTPEYERAYNIFLDLILLVLPLFILSATYYMITLTLCRTMRTEQTLKPPATPNNECVEVMVNSRGSTRCLLARTCTFSKPNRHDTIPTSISAHNTSLSTTNISNNNIFRTGSVRWSQVRNNWSEESATTTLTSTCSTSPKNHYHVPHHTTGLRRTNPEKSLQNKKRVIQMLFVVVLEFFVCWTPLYVINTVAMYDPQTVYQKLGITAISFFQLLAYTSSCCNPITYCFMNRAFRKSFMNLFKCFKRLRKYNNQPDLDGMNPNSELDSTASRAKWPTTSFQLSQR